jgi:hypothetical protein
MKNYFTQVSFFGQAIMAIYFLVFGAFSTQRFLAIGNLMPRLSTLFKHASWTGFHIKK